MASYNPYNMYVLGLGGDMRNPPVERQPNDPRPRVPTTDAPLGDPSTVAEAEANIVKSGTEGLLNSIGKNKGEDLLSADAQKAPWSAQQPYLIDLFKRADALYKEGGGLYPGFGEDTTSAQNMVRGLAGDNSFMQGATGNLSSLMGGGYNPGMSPIYSAMGRTGYNPALGMNMATATGGFLNANPYLDATFNQAANQVSNQFRNATVPSIRGSFGLAGGFNRPGEQQALGQAQQNLGNTLGNLATNIYGGNYANERGLMQQAIGNIGNLYNVDTANLMKGGGALGNMYTQGQQTQLGALGLAPQLNAAQYYGAGQLAGIGEQQDQLARQRAMDPWQRLQLYGQNVTGNYTSPVTQQQRQGGGIGGLIGAGAGALLSGGNPMFAGLGYQIGSNIFRGGPWDF